MGSFCIKYHYEDNFIFKKKSGRESGPLLRGHTLSAPGSAGEEAGSHFSPASVRLTCRCGRSLAPRAQPRADSPAETGASPRLSNAAGALLRLDTHVPQAAASSRSAATWRLKPCRTLFGPVKTPGASLSLKLPSAHTFGSCIQGASGRCRPRVPQLALRTRRQSRDSGRAHAGGCEFPETEISACKLPPYHGPQTVSPRSLALTGSLAPFRGRGCQLFRSEQPQSVGFYSFREKWLLRSAASSARSSRGCPAPADSAL